MQTTTFSKAKTRLTTSMDQVTNDREPLLITRRSAEPVVMIGLADYESLLQAANSLHLPDTPQQ
ncbi:type II toxin-antitoxin system Phd/YefM family antitoxin [Pseudomonas sp. SWRI99]|uniref:type II toxin-antitoxin system Phd/YefM family antitoxin n=1 Tax=Pseudomonas sp. SWRI99 TaxID=2745506 RepID=UPI001648B938|nr:type II toxin-antitoxin system Phd/YefM family antitoxin [Pseudomonas sp. SWRI99]MBC3775739.1 type II toxin-antitoxin system Phd/YefM family antitoxin [Pseudomonas sp. SWRI99]